MMQSMDQSETAANASLPGRLRRETAALHAQAERAGIMPDLLRGKINRRTYCTLLRNLHDIYVVLERELATHATNKFVAPIYATELRREAAIVADLDALHGAGWEREIEIATACAEYTRRLREVGESRPELLVAHAYVRYLGDLSGGQMLLAIVAKALQINGDGVRFYEFPEPGAAALAARFRAGLGTIHAEEATVAEIVKEAMYAFELHVCLFEELAEDEEGRTKIE
jgi:heme oxygenase